MLFTSQHRGLRESADPMGCFAGYMLTPCRWTPLIIEKVLIGKETIALKTTNAKLNVNLVGCRSSSNLTESDWKEFFTTCSTSKVQLIVGQLKRCRAAMGMPNPISKLQTFNPKGLFDISLKKKYIYINRHRFKWITRYCKFVMDYPNSWIPLWTSAASKHMESNRFIWVIQSHRLIFKIAGNIYK